MTGIALLVGLAGCGGPTRPAPVADGAVTIRLADLPFAELTLPPHSHPTDDPIPTQIPLDGPWKRDKAGPHRGFTAPIPIRPRGLFFYKPEPGIRVVDRQGAEVPFVRSAAQALGAAEWVHDRESVSLWLGDRGARPEPGEFFLVYPKATEREARLNLKWSGLEPAAFAWATIQDGWDARTGLLIPAPAVAAWDLAVPPAAELSFYGGVVAPEIGVGTGSDGAELTVEVEADGVVTPAWTGHVDRGAFTLRRVDLSRWAGQQVRLRLRSVAAGTALYDYVFAAEPVVASRKANPVRVLMVFIDTLRVDHTSLYGYHRDTTAAIDHLATEGKVFDTAYSVAPWTLPSARAIVTGRQPELYASAQTLPEILGKKGYANAFFAGNVYLSVNFDMNRGWDLHRIGGLWPPAEKVTEDALQWLADHEGRDALLQVHYMDTHLPYREPAAYRHTYAGDAYPGLGEEFFLTDVKRAKVESDPDAQQYIRDRYDNNIRRATDQVQRLLDQLDDNDIVLVYADHGEEFYDHGQYEHGHTLFDELVHVPLVIDGPGIDGGRVDAPVSLLDLTPTILDLVGEPLPEGLDGRSLAPLLHGEPGAADAFAHRPLGFGRPLYGLERWGVLADGKRKWTTSEGHEALYDLTADPGEKTNLLIQDPSDAGAPYRDALAQAVGRPVDVGWRITASAVRGRPDKELWALCTVPGGYRDAWPGADPMVNAPITVRKVDDPAELTALLAAYQVPDHRVGPDDRGVELCWHPGGFGAREVYLVPERPLAEAGPAMQCSAYSGDASGGKRGTMRLSPGRDPGPGAVRTPLGKLAFDERQVLWQLGIGPVPGAGASVVGRDGETDSMLIALGYKDRDGGDATLPEGEAAGALRPCEPPTITLPPIPSSKPRSP